ncbi:hypothetical protein KSP39_PZI007911 [Platanthera zijinensis]|uniref:Methyltransferase type 11 domain-containing protein n=1 Tax=Platanthera zijinensis TaxID=2320716 RepID=A0AAP0G8N0_9ASPA
MDRYQRVEKPREETPINKNEIHITTQGRMHSYITYATSLIQEKGHRRQALLRRSSRQALLWCSSPVALLWRSSRKALLTGLLTAGKQREGHHKKNSAFQSLPVSLFFCVSVGAGYEVAALQDSGIVDVTGVEVIDFPPLVKRADLHNLPFFYEVFDLGFNTSFDASLFPKRFVEEIERTVRRGSVTALTVGGRGLRMGWWTLRSYFNGHPFWRLGNL